MKKLGLSSGSGSMNKQGKAKGNDQVILLDTGPLHDRGGSGKGASGRGNGQGGRRPTLAIVTPQTPVLLLTRPHTLLLLLITTSYNLVLLELKHENRVPLVAVVILVLVEKPVVHVPRDLHVRPVDLHPLAPSELPLQTPHFQNLLLVHAEQEPQTLVLVLVTLAVYSELSSLTSEARSRLVHSGALRRHVDVVALEEEELVSWRVVGVGVGLGGLVADEEGEGVVDEEGEVESGAGFWAGPEPGVGEVPEEEGVVGEFFGAVFSPGLDADVERGVVVEVDVEGATEHGA